MESGAKKEYRAEWRESTEVEGRRRVTERGTSAGDGERNVVSLSRRSGVDMPVVAGRNSAQRDTLHSAAVSRRPLRPLGPLGSPGRMPTSRRSKCSTKARRRQYRTNGGASA